MPGRLWTSKQVHVPDVLADVVDHICDTIHDLNTTLPEVFEYDEEHVTVFRWRTAPVWFELDVHDEPHHNPCARLCVYDERDYEIIADATFTGDQLGAVDTVMKGLRNHWPCQWATWRGRNPVVATCVPEKLFTC